MWPAHSRPQGLVLLILSIWVLYGYKKLSACITWPITALPNRFYLSVDHMEKRPKRISNFEEFTLKKEIPSSDPQSTTEATYYDNGFVGVAQ